MATSKPKIEREPGDTIFAWWCDQPLGDHGIKREMRAFDRLPSQLRDAVNDCPLNVLPSTVQRSIKLWGYQPTFDTIRALSQIGERS